MVYTNKLIAALVAAVAVGGCTMDDAANTALSSDDPLDAPALVAAADWSRAETVTVALSSYHFAPDRLQFRKDAPYHLHLVNKSGSAHTFTSEGFFGAIACVNRPRRILLHLICRASNWKPARNRICILLLPGLEATRSVARNCCTTHLE